MEELTENLRAVPRVDPNYERTNTQGAQDSSKHTHHHPCTHHSSTSVYFGETNTHSSQERAPYILPRTRTEPASIDSPALTRDTPETALLKPQQEVACETEKHISTKKKSHNRRTPSEQQNKTSKKLQHLHKKLRQQLPPPCASIGTIHT